MGDNRIFPRIPAEEMTHQGDILSQRFANLQRVAQKITSTLDLGKLLERIRDEAKLAVPSARESCLLLFEEETSELIAPLHCSLVRADDPKVCSLCKETRAIIKLAQDRGELLACVNREMGCGGCSLRTVPIGSELAIPLKSESGLVGVLTVVADEGSKFTEREKLFFEDLAGLAANSLANAKEHQRASESAISAARVIEHLSKFVPSAVKQITEKGVNSLEEEKVESDVSVMFLDLEGYSALSERLEQERLNFIIERYFSAYMDIINENGGDINETAGDGLMVIFRGEGPQEHARKAVSAALSIQKRTKQINEDLAQTMEPIAVNIGINSGPAFVGPTKFEGISGARWTFTASGPMTNIAARVRALATGGEAVVAEEAARRVKAYYQLEDLGSHSLKNVSKPVRAFRLVREREDEVAEGPPKGLSPSE